MRILLAGGGTVGHINPALAIANYAVSKDKNTKILFVGTKRGLESTLVPEAGYDIKYVNVQGLSKKLTLDNIKSFYNMVTAKGKCKKIIKEFRPDVVVGTGGYVCAPAVMAANSLGIPTLIHEQNVFPGSAIKLLSKKSTVTAISFDDSRAYLKDAKNILFTGNPIRPEILSCNREKARQSYGITNEKLVLIFGGSLGADAINSVALEYIKSLSVSDGVRVLFATGQRNYDDVINKAKSMKLENLPFAQIVPYIHNMDEAMNAADVAVCRSGAITVSELCALSKPAIFVPSPNVTNNHQEYNARALSDSGAAITILEKDFNFVSLKTALNSILTDDSKLEQMQIQSSKVGTTSALNIIHSTLTELAKS